MTTNIKNIGIYAHVDAGKTTLTEQLLYKAGCIRKLGSVDDGNTHTDTMDLERERGISIMSAPISFPYKDQKINLIDTPGHVDFVAEVERSMLVLDAAVLVISAKEGVQSHTKLLFGALRRLQVPTIIFINKIDRMGVQTEQVVGQIQTMLSQRAVPLHTVLAEGVKQAEISALYTYDYEEMVDKLAEVREDLLEQYVNGEAITEDMLNDHIAGATGTGDLYPIVFGSAMNGIGVQECMDAIYALLPCYQEPPVQTGTEPSGIVFKVQRNHVKTKQTYVKVTRGMLKLREMAGADKVTSIMALESGAFEQSWHLTAGDIGVVGGLTSLGVGDCFGAGVSGHRLQLARPTLKVKVSPNRPSMRAPLLNALEILAEADPYLDFQLDPYSEDIEVKLFGHVQMEIVADTLQRDYAVEATFDDPTVIYLETIDQTAESVFPMSRRVHHFAAGLGLRIEPLPEGCGFEYISEITTGYLQQSYQNAVEDGIREYMDQGLLGWELTDMRVSLIDYEYNSVDSTPRDYRALSPLVLFDALKKIGTKLLWPVNHFRLTVPADGIGKAIADLSQMKAVFGDPVAEGNHFVLEGEVPVETSLNYEATLRQYTDGAGSFESKFSGYQPAPEQHVAKREKRKVDPANKGLYMLSKKRTV